MSKCAFRCPDKISYLTNETIKNANVKIFDVETMSMVESVMYDESKINANDPYDIFLSGAVPLITIENKNCEREKELFAGLYINIHNYKNCSLFTKL